MLGTKRFILTLVFVLAGLTAAGLYMKAGLNGVREGPGFFDYSGMDTTEYRQKRLREFVELLSHPALTLPAGFIDGAPVGFQLIGRANDEMGLLASGQRIEEFKPWSAHPAGLE